MCVSFCLRVCRKWPPGSGYLCPALIREPVSSAARTAPGGGIVSEQQGFINGNGIIRVPRLSGGGGRSGENRE